MWAFVARFVDLLGKKARRKGRRRKKKERKKEGKG
jgi:hypothetical protein